MTNCHARTLVQRKMPAQKKTQQIVGKQAVPGNVVKSKESVEAKDGKRTKIAALAYGYTMDEKQVCRYQGLAAVAAYFAIKQTKDKKANLVAEETLEHYKAQVYIMRKDSRMM